jgi:hypothetical protein
VTTFGAASNWHLASGDWRLAERIQDKIAVKTLSPLRKDKNKKCH